MARLAINKNVLRDLALRSRNQCAFPGCDHPILNPEGVYVAELCHIEAAAVGGPRFNAAQSDEHRRSYDNLLFLCHRHHRETDNDRRFPVAELTRIKQEHEKLPEIVFNHELLLDGLERVAAQQQEISNWLQSHAPISAESNSYEIRTSWIADAWTPESGRYYESRLENGAGFKFMMRGGWLHVEQTLRDAAIAYYEINSEGSVRQSNMPYPINEYRVEVSETLILRKDRVKSAIGDYGIRTVLKWSLGSVTEHFVGNLLAGVDCQARCQIDHGRRLIYILNPSK